VIFLPAQVPRKTELPVAAYLSQPREEGSAEQRQNGEIATVANICRDYRGRSVTSAESHDILIGTDIGKLIFVTRHSDSSANGAFERNNLIQMIAASRAARGLR
jgi:hypothetical protein